VKLVNSAPPSCVAGGFTYEVEGSAQKNEVCNGKNGTSGFTATLPPEAEETGTWLFRGLGIVNTRVPISFSIPLSSTDAAQIQRHIWVEGEPFEQDPECQGGTVDAPVAEAGSICLFLNPALNEGGEFHEVPDVQKPGGGSGVGTSGAMLYRENTSAEYQVGGSYAITAPEAP